MILVFIYRSFVDKLLEIVSTSIYFKGKILIQITKENMNFGALCDK